MRPTATAGNRRLLSRYFVAICTASAFALAGCASSSSTAPAAQAGGGGQSASHTTWTIGSICSCSGVFASTFGPGGPAIQAWADWTNAHGGIDGHPVKLIFMDDAGNPTTTLADVKTLVEEDHIIALVGQTDANPSVWGQYITGQGVPVIGGENQGPPWNSSPDFFTDEESYSAQYAAFGSITKTLGAKNMGALSCAETPSCAAATQAMLAGARAVGVAGQFSQLVSSTAANYTPTCLAAKAAGVDVLGFETTTPTFVTTVQDCANQGYRPHLILVGDGANQSVLGNPALYGTQIVAGVYPFFDANGPGEDFHAAMAKYAAKTTISQPAAAAWGAGLLFRAAAEAGRLGANPTPQDVIKGLYALPAGETLGGFTAPLTFKAGQSHINQCYFRFTITSSGFAAPYGTTAVCPS